MRRIASTLRVSLLSLILVAGDDKMFICSKFQQRLMYYGGEPWEAWEQEHLDKFYLYLRTEGLSLPPGYREEEVNRNVQASNYKYKIAY